MINLSELLEKVEGEGYKESFAEAKLCQDILLLLFSKSAFNKNVTIKGGVVMRSLSKNVRRATVDIDLDLIKYPLTEEGIKKIISALNGHEGIQIKILGKPENLKHQDYKGKRLFVDIEDKFGNRLTSKIDFGVHKYLSLRQKEYCFDISASPEGASLLINSKEQMFAEKLKSLLKFGTLSTRFKDIYDMYYLSTIVDKEELLHSFQILIFSDQQMREKNTQNMFEHVQKIFNDNEYLNRLSTSKKNWLTTSTEEVLDGILSFIKSL